MNSFVNAFAYIGFAQGCHVMNDCVEALSQLCLYLNQTFFCFSKPAYLDELDTYLKAKPGTGKGKIVTLTNTKKASFTLQQHEEVDRISLIFVKMITSSLAGILFGWAVEKSRG